MRYAPDKPFPRYTHTPGETPHPVKDPDGHSFGSLESTVPPLDPARWSRSEAYCYAVDLFNHGYYWEAHETWEGLWHAAGREGIIADFLKGLIKLAAAGVKMRQGIPAGVETHSRRAAGLLEQIRQSEQTERFAGIYLPMLIERARTVQQQVPENRISPPQRPEPVFPWELELR